MRLSLSSVLSTLFLTSIMMLLSGWFLKSNRFVRFFGPQTAMIFLGAVIVRLVLPLEFPFTITILFRKVYTDIYAFFNMEIRIGESVLALYQILLAVWFLGSAAVLLQNGIVFRRTRKKSRELIRLRDDQRVFLEEELLQEFPELKTACVLKVDLRISPMLIGMKRPVILLPDYPFTKEELRYVLGHEALHIRHHDLRRNYLMEGLVCLYWWNFFLRRLQSSVFEMIEIKNDMVLTRSLSKREKKAYMNCLAKISVFANEEKVPGVLSFTKKSIRTLERRFNFIVHNRGTGRIKKAAALLGAGLMVFLTASVVFEPMFSPPPGTKEFTAEDTYAVFQDGYYDVYFLHKERGPIRIEEGAKDLKYYPRGIKIYKEE